MLDVSKEKITTLLASTGRFVGDFHLEESVYIKGFVQGSVLVTGEGMLVSVADGACIDGAVEADQVMVSGKIKGSISAKIIRLATTAVVDGALTYDRLLVADGAVINSTRMISPRTAGMVEVNPAPVRAVAANHTVTVVGAERSAS